VLTNHDLERIVDTSDEWIVSRTGIRERRVAAADETTASMAAVASKRALATAGLDADDIDVILLATLTPDYWMPSTAALVKEAIGNNRAFAMDVAAACSGFVYAWSAAQAYITSGMARHVLVIGAELLTRFLDYTDRNTCILFGDGAGAVILSASEEPGGSLGIELTTEPQGAYMIWLPAGGAKSPPSRATVERGEHFIPSGVAAGVEGRGGNYKNRRVDEEREAQRNRRIHKGKVHRLALPLGSLRVLPRLHDGRMQIKIVRHHRRAEYADRDVQHTAVAHDGGGRHEAADHFGV
jgi:hypothetical protein